MAKNLNDVYSKVEKNHVDRHKEDLYETPPLATYILHKYGNVPHKIVEPCAGRGNISVELLRLGYDVTSYDLTDHPNKVSPVLSGYDVLSHKKLDCDGWVTNPPYFSDLPRKIAEKSIVDNDYTALFVRLTFLEGIKRNKMFTETPPSDIIFLSDRVRFKPNLSEEPVNIEDQLGGMIAYAWVIWNWKSTHENTKLKWVLLRDEYDEWKSRHNFA